LIVSVPDSVGYVLGRALGALIGDVVITREEIEGFKANLIYADAPAAGRTRLTDWAKEHRDTLGIRYTSELARRNDRRLDYRKT
jgi:NADH dehydrogenase